MLVVSSFDPIYYNYLVLHVLLGSFALCTGQRYGTQRKHDIHVRFRQYCLNIR